MGSEKTFWDIIQTVLAVIGGTYALIKIVVSDWRRLFGTPKLKIYLPPAVGVIVSGVDPKKKDLDYIPPRLHLRLTIFNNSPRVAVIDRMDVVVKDSEGAEMTFKWNLFYEHVPGENAVRTSSPIRPVTLGAHTPVELNVQFLIERVPKLDIFYDGIYACNLRGWLAGTKPDAKPAFTKSFSFSIPDKLKTIVNNPFFEEEVATDIPISPL